MEWKSNPHLYPLSRRPSALWICMYTQNTSGRAYQKQPQWLSLRKRMEREHGSGRTYKVCFCSMLSPQVIQNPEHALGAGILGLSDFLLFVHGWHFLLYWVWSSSVWISMCMCWAQSHDSLQLSLLLLLLTNSKEDKILTETQPSCSFLFINDKRGCWTIQ